MKLGKTFHLDSQLDRGITRDGQISSQRRVPIELEKPVSKTSSGPKHFTGPSDSNRILLKSKKFVKYKLDTIQIFCAPPREPSSNRVRSLFCSPFRVIP